MTSWWLNNIKDWQAVCYSSILPAHPLYDKMDWATRPGTDIKQSLNPVTRSLIGISFRLGLSEITEANLYFWSSRIEIIGYPVIQEMGDKGWTTRQLEFNDIKRHIGLKTDAPYITLTDWIQNQ